MSKPSTASNLDPARGPVTATGGGPSLIEKGDHLVESPMHMAWRRFRRHKLGMIGLTILVVLFLTAIFAGFLAPYSFENEQRELLWARPNVRLSDAKGFSVRPFVHPLKLGGYDDNFNQMLVEDTNVRCYVRFFVQGDEHKLLGLFDTRLRLMGVDPVPPSIQAQTGEQYYSRMYVMGADLAGRDIFSRIIYGSRISMTIGLVGSLFVLIIGLSIGGTMGYFGGRTDDALYSFSQMIMLLPGFYLLLMLRFMFPADMDSVKIYFAVILILSLVGWPSFAIVIRGMVKAIRGMDYVQAARAVGLGDGRIIFKHVLPNTIGYVVVATTLRIPSYILGESALSLLGLGIMEPTPSWGNMLQKAMDIAEMNQHPWVLWPGVFIFLAVMAFNLVGDALRDAVDPRMTP